MGDARHEVLCTKAEAVGVGLRSLQRFALTNFEWSARGFGAGPLIRSIFDHDHVSTSSACTSIEKSRVEPWPP